MKIAGIVLAAGRSGRMGENKLLLPFEGEPLVRRAVRIAAEGGLEPVLVVVGHEADRVREALAGLPCRLVSNPRHALGQSTSLDAGVAAVPDDAGAAVVLLADMPRVDAAAIRALVERQRATGAALVTSRYGETTAPPVLYDRSIFAELRGGEGEGRGREVVRRHAGEVAFVDHPAGALVDVDRPGDLEAAERGPQAR